jgi:hypothetical protein
MIDRTRAGRINYYSNPVLVIRALTHIILLLYYLCRLAVAGWHTCQAVGVCSYYTRSVSSGWCTPPNQLVGHTVIEEDRGADKHGAHLSCGDESYICHYELWACAHACPTSCCIVRVNRVLRFVLNTRSEIGAARSNHGRHLLWNLDASGGSVTQNSTSAQSI